MITFRYKAERTGKGKVVKRPIGDVFFQSRKGEWLEYYPYIDSGADVTLIPFSAGLDLGFEVEEEKVEEIGGIRGSVPVNYKEVLIRIGNKEMQIKVAWALIEEVPPLLGREGIFDAFHVTFKQDEEIIVFQPVS